jgi:DNA-binding transcriptional MerR regulator
MAELSRISETSTATIKYYIREGLLPPGELARSNQAHYTDEHVHRLRLIRALVDLGGLPLSRTREIVATLDAPKDETVLRAMTAQAPVPVPSTVPTAAAELRALAERQGWTVPAGSSAFALAVKVLGTLRDLGHENIAERLDAYAEAAEQVAAVDREALRNCSGIEQRAECLVVGNVLGDHLLAALRRLAQEGRRDTPAPALAA